MSTFDTGYFTPGMREQGQKNVVGVDARGVCLQRGSFNADVSGGGTVTFASMGLRAMLDTDYDVIAYNEANGDMVAVRSTLKTTSGFTYAGWTGEAVYRVIVIGPTVAANFQT